MPSQFYPERHRTTVKRFDGRRNFGYRCSCGEIKSGMGSKTKADLMATMHRANALDAMQEA